jgi:hypothetical protein
VGDWRHGSSSTALVEQKPRTSSNHRTDKKKKRKKERKKNKIGEQLTFGFYAKSLNSLFRATLGANLDVHVYFS